MGTYKARPVKAGVAPPPPPRSGGDPLGAGVCWSKASHPWEFVLVLLRPIAAIAWESPARLKHLFGSYRAQHAPAHDLYASGGLNQSARAVSAAAMLRSSPLSGIVITFCQVVPFWSIA